MRLCVLVITICSLLGPAAVVAQTTKPPSEEELKLQKLENTTRARGLYVQGESQYKKGDLEGAINSWAKALDLKPDSAYTQKCLTKARNELYKRYKDTVAKGGGAQDRITSLATLDRLLPLLPDRPDLQTRRAEIENSLSPDERKAFAFYTEAMGYVAKNDVANAKKAIDEARKYARESQCIKDAAQYIDRFSRSGGSVAVEAPKQLPKLYMFFATWCGPCKRMRPTIESLEQEFKGKVEVSYIDIDQNKQLDRKYEIEAVPTLIFFDRNGRQFRKLRGGGSRETIIEIFNKMGVK